MSNWVKYEFWYDYKKKEKYGEKTELCYIDTES